MTNKLYKEGQSIKDKMDKKRKEKIIAEEKNKINEYALEKSFQKIQSLILSIQKTATFCVHAEKKSWTKLYTNQKDISL